MEKGIAIIIICVFIVVTAAACRSKDSSSGTGASETEEDLSEGKSKLNKEFAGLLENGIFNGYVYISKKDTVLLDKGYGKADFEKGIENTRETKFDIGSLTKQFTAVAILQLEDRGLLKVTDKIDQYLPAFPHGSEITIHQLLCHTSGLPEYSLDFDITKFRPSYKNFGVECSREKVTLSFTPGKSFQYSNPGYILLGYIVEQVSGKTLDVYFEENIFKPLNMTNTAFRDKNGQLQNFATGYENSNKKKSELSWTLLNVGFVYGSGGLCSTAEDLLKWAEALTEEKLISKEAYNKMYTPNKNYYGYGVYTYKDSKGRRSFEHYGTASGYRSYLFRAVDEDIKIIILTNYQSTSVEYLASIAKDCLEGEN